MGGRGAYSATFAERYYVPTLVFKPRTIYEKNPDKLTEYEKAGIRHLERNGIYPVVPEENPDAPANIDLLINGEPYDLKNVTNVASSVGNQVGRARKQWWKSGLPKPMRTVFTTEGAVDEFDVIADALFARKRDDEVFIVLSEDGRMRTQ